MSARSMFYPESTKFTERDERLFARTDFVYNVTEDILVALESLELSKQDLANKLGKSRSFVTQILSGSRNMTLGTLSDICYVLEIKPRLELHHREENNAWSIDHENELNIRKKSFSINKFRDVSANQENPHWELSQVDKVACR